MATHLKLLQLPNVGNGGRLGNCLFTIASTIGLALRHGYTPRFPADWKYRKYFNIPYEWFGEIKKNSCDLKEWTYEYDCTIGHALDTTIISIVSLSGYLQSPKYWEGYEKEIRQYLTPKNTTQLLGCAVHFRRGDYVNNPNYVELPMCYYLNAIDKVKKQTVFFVDDTPFLKLHFVSEKYQALTEMEDFELMAGFSHHITSNSTFSWWAAYLSGGKVIRPDAYFSGELAKRCSTKDLYPAEWEVMATGNKYDLSDVTFVIPVTFDHTDRIANVRMVVDFLNLHFNTNILIGEVNTRNFTGAPGYVHFTMPTFHRTKVINDLTRMAKTPYVFNWDADVLVTPYQLYLAVKRLRAGVEVVYPYDGTFYMIDRIYKPANLNSLDSLINCRKDRVGATGFDADSYGGAVGYNVASFWKAGGENEMHINYSNEDFERWTRFRILGLNVERVNGALYHINHYRGTNSSFRHENGRNNMMVWDIQKTMSKDQFIKLINHERWNNGMTLQDLKDCTK